MFYKATAAWGGHEGSMLLWITVLAVWTMAVAAGSRSQPQEFASRVLGVLGIVSAGIIAFALLTSNPFTRLIPAPADGNDLNPLLQDPGMIIHPPTLYLGYVGVAVPFAFAVAALLTGRLDKDWARWTRPWTIVAWMFLTAGITLGSWWAYYELGWGGWWFWDPVENSSFMPWLMTTALLHSLAVTERRGIFKSWTVLLAIAAFSLSLFGTFLTRSPVMISVHAFAADPTRGLFILGLLGLFSGGALLLYAARARNFEAEGGFKLVSREAFLLANNILLVIAAGVVLVGTLAPLFVDVLGFGTISVGPPYFNLMFLVPVLAARSAARHGHAHRLAQHAGRRVAASVALARGRGCRRRYRGAVHRVRHGVGADGAVRLDCAVGMRELAARSGATAGVPHGRAADARPSRHVPRPLRRRCFHARRHGRLGLQGRARRQRASWRHRQAGGYEFVFKDVRKLEGPNFVADEGEFELRDEGDARCGPDAANSRPIKCRSEPMTEAAIDTNVVRDVFVALGEPLGDNAWSLRLQVKPLIGFLWLGSGLMVLGGLFAITDRRYRVAVRQTQQAAAQPATGAA